MTFERSGKLTYEIKDGAKKQYVYLTFSTKGDILITDQPSSSRKEQTSFYFDKNQKLILKFNGVESRFVRKR